MKIRKTFIIILVSVMLLNLFTVIMPQKVDAVTINAQEVTLYTINDDCAQYGITIPENYKTSFQIKVTGTNIIPDYSVDNYIYLSVTDDGLIKTRGAGNTEGVVTVNVGNETFEVKVKVVDYLTEYIDNIIKQYISKNINGNMTEKEKMKKICEYICQYTYNTSPDYRYFPLLGGGDCLATSNMILRMCDMVGIRAYLRYAANEPGAGSGHRNVSAMLDGTVYRVEAAYDEPAPRSYTIEEEPEGFRWGYDGSTGDSMLIQYDGFAEEVNIPASRTVKKLNGDVQYDTKIIGKNAFSYPTNVGDAIIKKVTLPDTVEKIGESAFEDCEDLTTINFPKNLNEIGINAFKGCDNLTNIVVDSENNNYTFENGILYNKDKTEVILCAPGMSGEVVLDNKVKTIKANAFANCTKLTSIKLGANVETIEDKAFENCRLTSINIPKSVKNMGDGVFLSSYVKFVDIEEGCKAAIDESVFFAINSLQGIKIPSSVTTIEKSAFIGTNDVIFYVKDNSYALTWAENNFNAKRYAIIKSDNEIVPGMIVLKPDTFTYDGTEKRPEVVVSNGATILKENTDYTVSYENNIDSYLNPMVVVKGKGSYTGTAEKSFKINRASSDVSMQVSDVVYGQTPNPVLIENKAGSGWTDITYNTEKSIDGETETAPTEVGTYYVHIAVRMAKNRNYGTRNLWAKFNILQAENDLKISCPNVQFGNTPEVTVLKNTSGGNVTYYFKKQSEDDENYNTQIPTSIGKYTVKAVSEETHNYKSATTTVNFEITDKPVFQKGDVDGDGFVTISDCLAILRHVKEVELLTGEKLERAKIDNNDMVTISDYTALLRHVKEIELLN